MFRGAILILGLWAATLSAQAPERKPPKANQPPPYVNFPIDENPEQMLAEFLKSKAGQDIIQQMLEDDRWKNLLDQQPEILEQIKNRFGKDGAEKAGLQKMIEEVFKNHPGVQKGDRKAVDEAIKELGEKFGVGKGFAEQMMKEFEKKLGADGLPKFADELPNARPDAPDIDLPKFDDFVEDDFGFGDGFGEWLGDLLKDPRIQNNLNEFFKDSPDLQDAVGDFFRALEGPAGNGNWMPRIPDFGGGKWSFDFKPPKLPFELGQLPKLPSLKMPQLPRFNIPMPRLVNLGFPRMPGFGGPNMPAAPNLSGGSEWAYIALVILGAGLAWWFLSRLKWTPRSPLAQVAALLRALPTSITTRTQLRQAFDALALTLLGDKALPWNHRLIARQLGDTTQAADAADAFANLYEIARYTPGDDRLSRAEQDAVREALAVLTQGA
jgi:hypothetical protein